MQKLIVMVTFSALYQKYLFFANLYLKVKIEILYLDQFEHTQFSSRGHSSVLKQKYFLLINLVSKMKIVVSS